ncbi:MAG TPA: hypothetical protein VM406_08505 [Noviherbaspirillum sp.]|nr:hypothetical protein [Noviherbaspirillum sp.]
MFAGEFRSLRAATVPRMADVAAWPWILYPRPTALRQVTNDSFRFWLFMLANMLVGAQQAFAQYYRFAAAGERRLQEPCGVVGDRGQRGRGGRGNQQY